MWQTCRPNSPMALHLMVLEALNQGDDAQLDLWARERHRVATDVVTLTTSRFAAEAIRVAPVRIRSADSVLSQCSWLG